VKSRRNGKQSPTLFRDARVNGGNVFRLRLGLNPPISDCSLDLPVQALPPVTVQIVLNSFQAAPFVSIR